MQPGTLHRLFSKSLLFSLFFLISTIAAQAADVSNMVDLNKGRLLYDRRAKISYFDAGLTNNSDQTLIAPFRVIIDSISNSSVTSANSDGYTSDNKPYFDFTAPAILEPGSTTSLNQWRFNNPNRYRFNFTIGSIEGEIAGGNTPPTANAGEDRIISLEPGQSSALVTLNGSGSNDDDGNIVEYIWDGTPNPTDGMTSEILLTPGDYAFTLTVTDDDGATAADTVTITILESANLPPTADAGPDQVHTLSQGQTEMVVTLNGINSTDDDGTITGYTWSGSPDPDDIQSPTITLFAGTYVFSLTVIDDDGAASALDTVQIVVETEAITEQHQPQISVDPQEVSVDEGDSVTIIVNATDPDDESVSIAASPRLENAEFTAVPGLSADGTFTFSPDFDQQGIYVVAFTARDLFGNSITETAQINVNNVNRPPTITVPESFAVDEGGLLTIPVTSSDPDGDLLTVTAEPLPPGAIFILATGTITFAPDFEQAGNYTITCTADDGSQSNTADVTVTVNDIVGGGQAGELVLNVDDPENPTLQTSTRITGTVNMTGSQQPQRIETSLITGLLPVSGKQGETLDVTLQGQSSGDFVTHFADGISQANFGEGITVNSVTVNSETELVASITIDSGAATGIRAIRVTSGNETAVSMLVFNVSQGSSILTGTVVDPDTGQPIANAVVTIQGTNQSVTTDVNGVFTFADAPTGDLVLIINAADHQLITIASQALAETSSDIGEVAPRATVFDPTAPASVNLYSVIGRGMADIHGNLSLSQAKQTIIDTWMLVGGSAAGILDEYGNQLNPAVEGAGSISMNHYGVEALARKMVAGESVTLVEILYCIAFGVQWSEGDIPPLDQWLARLQEMIDQAWTDPGNPDHYMAILLFNRGGAVNPEPPVISFDTRLNALQANIMFASFLIHTFDAEGSIAQFHIPSKSWLDSILDIFSPAACFAAPGDPVVDPGVGGRQGMMRNFWANYFGLWENAPLGMVATIGGSALGIGTMVATVGGQVGQTIALAALSFVEGICADITMNAMVSLNLMTLVPSPPVAYTAEVVQPSGGQPPVVEVQFFRSVNDYAPMEDHTGGQHFWYTLYRYDNLPGSEDTQGKAVANFCTNCPEYFSGAHEMVGLVGKPVSIIDPAPRPNRVYYYDLVVSRVVGDNELMGGVDNLGSTLAPWLGIAPNLWSQLAKGNIFGPGIVLAALNPAYTLIQGLQQLTSDFSNPVVIYTGLVNTAVETIELDPESDYLYCSNTQDKALYRLKWNNDRLEENEFFTYTGFIDPGQIGLAIDAFGDIYTDNHASDSLYGGRIFRFDPSDRSRELAGTVNYFSQLLMLAHPTAVSCMATGPLGGSIYIMDEISKTVKQLLIVDSTIDPSHNVSHPKYSFIDYLCGPVTDMEFANDQLHVLANSTDGGLPDMQCMFPNYSIHRSSTPDDGWLYPYASLASSETYASYVGRGIAVDAYGNVYMAVKHPQYATGEILMFARDACEDDPLCQPISIMDGMYSLGDIELSKDGRAIYYMDDFGIEKKYFGVSGSITDDFGMSLVGATITYETLMGSKTITVNPDGSYFIPEAFRHTDVSGTPMLSITITYGNRVKSYLLLLSQPGGLDPYGHILHNIEVVW